MVTSRCSINSRAGDLEKQPGLRTAFRGQQHSVGLAACKWPAVCGLSARLAGNQTRSLTYLSLDACKVLLPFF